MDPAISSVTVLLDDIYFMNEKDGFTFISSMQFWKVSRGMVVLIMIVHA